ncbi:MAG: S16 family serine protease [Pirellulales bacterium]
MDRAEWWALYDELVAQQPPTLDKDEAYQAELPVLFVRDEFSQAKGMIQVGRVGLLSISRKSEGPILYPELGAMGLTTLSVGEDDGFLNSIQRVWDISKLASTDSHRYSWRIVRHPRAKRDSLAFPRFHNRSCEAAFLCTLWAASGGIPGDDEDKRMGVDSLDIRSTVTAKLGRLPVSGKLRDIPLEGVHGLPEKTQAADDAGIDTIIVANGHDPEELQRIPKELLERIAIIPLKTMGEVFDQLVSMSRYTRRFREACSVYFRSQFQPVDDDGNPVGGEQGADGGGQRAG